MYQESKDHATAYFITLTYEEENLPYLNASTGQYPIRLTTTSPELKEDDYLEAIVYKKDLQNFIKNVRRQTEHHVNKYDQNQTLKKLKSSKNQNEKNHYKNQLKEIHKEYRIRYYFTSEYGTKSTKRPHYHGIIWNLQPPIANKLELQKIWTMGNTDISPIDHKVQTYYYLTKYMFKQRNFNIWSFPPFQLMSTKPFIGNRYLETSKQYHYGKQDLITKFNGKDLILPRIYTEKFSQKLRDLTKTKINTILAQQEQKEIQKQKNNHHIDILAWFKQQTAEKKDEIENLHFINKFRQ